MGKLIMIFILILLNAISFAFNSDRLILEKKNKKFQDTIFRYEKVLISDTLGQSYGGYFFEKNDENIILTDNVDPSDSLLSAVSIQAIKKIKCFKPKPQDKVGNLMMASGVTIGVLGAVAFITGSIGTSNSNSIFQEDTMFIGIGMIPFALLQFFIGKELNEKTYQIKNGAFRILMEK